MPKEFSRTERVADHLMRELAQLIQQELRDPRIGMVSVNEVEVSRDIANAKVYVTFMDTDAGDDVDIRVQVMNRAAGFLRSQVARQSSMRTVPRLRFVFDNTQRRGRYLSTLIDEAVATDRARNPDSLEPGENH